MDYGRDEKRCFSLSNRPQRVCLFGRLQVLLLADYLVVKNLPPKKNLKLSSARRSRDFGFSRGAFLAACGGENRPNYFKNRPHKNLSAPAPPMLRPGPGPPPAGTVWRARVPGDAG